MKKHSSIFFIIQWGKERAIIEEVGTRQTYIITHQYLMNLDEMGCIIA